MSSGSIHGNDTNDVSFKAKAALAANYVAVKKDTTVNTVAVCTANTDETIGFIQQTQATADGPVPVRTEGFSLGLAGAGGWTIGDKLTPASATTSGELVTTTTAGNLVCAIAMDTVSAAENGEIQIISPAQLYSTFA